MLARIQIENFPRQAGVWQNTSVGPIAKHQSDHESPSGKNLSKWQIFPGKNTDLPRSVSHCLLFMQILLMKNYPRVKCLRPKKKHLTIFFNTIRRSGCLSSQIARNCWKLTAYNVKVIAILFYISMMTMTISLLHSGPGLSGGA